MNLIRGDEFGFYSSGSHLQVVNEYFLNLCGTCDFSELPSQKFIDKLRNAIRNDSARKMASFAQELKNIFMVPRLKKFPESQNRVKKYQLVDVFIVFLLQLLSCKTDSIDPCKYRIGNLEKELRLLLTILGDRLWMLCDNEHEEFQNLLAEFESVANEAGNLVHSLLFSTDQEFEKVDEGLGVVLNHFDLVKASTMKFLNLLQLTSRAYVTPKTSAMDSLHIVDSLIYDLKDLMKREEHWIPYVIKDQIKILHQRLVLFRSCIKDIGAPRPSEIGEMVQPLMQIGDMSHEAEYLIISFLAGDAPLWYLINRLTNINQRISLIGTELQEITKKFKFGGLTTIKYSSAQLPLLDKRNTEVDHVTVGFEDKTIHILDQLVGQGEHLQVISIFGMPGIGKTTLAKKLYNHPTVNYWFDKLSWCVVSQTYLRQSILAHILIHIKSEFETDRILEMDEESLIEHIYKTLKGRRYLIVMDDIWTSNVWDDSWRCFPDDGNGSRILFTSRNKDVAPPNSTIHELPFLSNDQCWELLEKKVFGSKPCPPELLRIGKKIAANCCGLPLAVVVIAGILSTMDRERSIWEEVLGNLASYIFEGGENSSVMQILELSYKHLPDHLKPCFLYFGEFENKVIPVGELIRLWIAGGFVHKEEEKSAENVAEEHLMVLIDKGLVTVAKKRSDGGVKACVIHDLLRDLCFKTSKEENFRKFSEKYEYSKYKKGDGVQVLERSAISNYPKHVRHTYDCFLTSPCHVHDMRLVRVLPRNYVGNYLIGVGYLVNLRYLVIGDLPSSIGSLVNLEYLRLETYRRVYLPAAIARMMKLRYIHAGYEARYDEYCNISQTNNLEFLSHIIISTLKDAEMLKCSPHLCKLKCKIEAYQYFDLRFFTQLESLNVRFYKLGQEKVIFPSNIKKLTLSGFMLPWEEMLIIGRLEKLEVLKLGFNVVAEGRWHTRESEFQKLRFLKLCVNHLTQWTVASKDHFPNLQQLILSDCQNLQEIPSEIGEIATMHLIEVKGKCSKSLVESVKRIQQEQWDMGNEELRVITNTTTDYS